MLSRQLLLLPTLALLLEFATAHSSHNEQQPLGQESDWATRHMAEEHHISNFDPGAFFSLHDFSSAGVWTASDIRRTYGLDDADSIPSSVTEGRKQEIVNEAIGMFDGNGDGIVERGEWMAAWRGGKRLRDYGLGPGHHGDGEYEYEIHHFERFHDENTREEDLTHPEDIAHFKKHDQEADAADRQEELDRMPIVEQNIPQKFRRVP